jgi:hypothetical protein
MAAKIRLKVALGRRGGVGLGLIWQGQFSQCQLPPAASPGHREPPPLRAELG